MIERRALVLLGGAWLLVCIFAAGYRIHALAQGAPTEQPLFYSGVLEVDGAPATGKYTIKLALYAAATGGRPLCHADGDVQVEAGRFRIDASNCADALAAEPDAWVGLTFVDANAAEHAIAKRSKIGAVPYALEAQHSVSASDSSGALADTIADLQDRIKTLEQASGQSAAFIAYKTTGQTINADSPAAVLFDEEVVDVSKTYDPEEGKFTAPADGLYAFTCTIAWSVAAGGNPETWEAALAINGWEQTFSGARTDGFATTRSLSSVFQLEKGDGVTCTALTGATTADLLIDHDGYNAFTGYRIR